MRALRVPSRPIIFSVWRLCGTLAGICYLTLQATNPIRALFPPSRVIRRSCSYGYTSRPLALLDEKMASARTLSDCINRSYTESMCIRVMLACLAGACIASPAHSQQNDAFSWPNGARAAVSLSFDDARTSQVDVGLDLFDRLGVRVTFYVVPSAVEQRLEGWRRLRDAGHEIGNHSRTHPCSGNFAWSRENALETYTLDRIREDLAEANDRIDELLGVTPEVFAYPCGQTFVGRDAETRSYVPVVSEMFLSGRGWRDEAPNAPTFVDMAQVLGMEMDGTSFDEIRAVVEQAKEEGSWVVLAGHEIGDGGTQTTHVDMLERLIRYAKDPANEIWLTPVGTASRYVLEERR